MFVNICKNVDMLATIDSSFAEISDYMSEQFWCSDLVTSLTCHI